jgi:type I restriction enzyme S subunit
MQKFPSSGQDDALPVIKIAQLRAGDLSGADQASREIEPQYIVHDGDVLFSWSGSLECALWSGGTGALNQHLFKVTPKSNYPRWLCYFGIHHFLEFFREIAAGKATTMGHIQRHHLSDTKLALPCASNLDTMNKPIHFIFEAMWMRTVEARKLSFLRDTLLPKLISGEIRVPEAEDWVEGALP